MTEPALRQTAFAIEQMAHGGIERADPGQVTLEDLQFGTKRLNEVRARLGAEQAPQLKAVKTMLSRADQLHRCLSEHQAASLVYIDTELFGLTSRLRSTAIEIDFGFGDRDGKISVADLRQARVHYCRVRGPVGWNRLLATDEVERRLYPARTLRSSDGTKLLPTEWLATPPHRLQRLRRVARYLSDSALARTFADIAARFACAPEQNPFRTTYEGALVLLGQEIRKRNSVRPTITDIARIGSEDPEIKALLNTPIEMSRRLKPTQLIDRFLE